MDKVLEMTEDQITKILSELERRSPYAPSEDTQLKQTIKRLGVTKTDVDTLLEKLRKG